MTALTSLGVDVDAALDYGNYGRSRRPLGIEYIYICISLYIYIYIHLFFFYVCMYMIVHVDILFWWDDKALLTTGVIANQYGVVFCCGRYISHCLLITPQLGWSSRNVISEVTMDAMMIMMYGQLCNYVLLMGCGHLKGEKKSGANIQNYQLCWCELQPLKDLTHSFKLEQWNTFKLFNMFIKDVGKRSDICGKAFGSTSSHL